MENIRLFVGIACPQSVSSAISVLMSSMAASLPFRKWTHPEDLHVTLHFLGDTPPQRVKAIQRALEETAARNAAPVLAIAEPGIFGPVNAPRILWLGLQEQETAAGSLKQLHQALRPGLTAAGCRLEKRPFRAHMTLARQGGAGCAPDAVRAAWHTALEDLPNASEMLQWTASGITLFRSHLGQRPSYEKLCEFPFETA